MKSARLEDQLRPVRGAMAPTKATAAVSAAMAEQEPSDRRIAPRYMLHRNLLIRRRGEVPTPGILINISESGAAVRIEPLADLNEGLWPYYLANGDDIWLTGLLKEPVDCWVVGVDRDVLRVRFTQDDAMLPGLRALARIAASR